MGTIEALHYILTKVPGASRFQDIDQITVIRNRWLLLTGHWQH